MNMHNPITATETHQDAPKATRRRLTPQEQIQAAKEALARAQRRQRTHDTRSKIILGGFALNWVRNDPQAAKALLYRMNGHPPRPQDMDALADVREELMQLVRANDSGQPAHHDG